MDYKKTKKSFIVRLTALANGFIIQMILAGGIYPPATMWRSYLDGLCATD